MSHPLDTDALYHCACGDWHYKWQVGPYLRHKISMAKPNPLDLEALRLKHNVAFPKPKKK